MRFCIIHGVRNVILRRCRSVSLVFKWWSSTCDSKHSDLPDSSTISTSSFQPSSFQPSSLNSCTFQLLAMAKIPTATTAPNTSPYYRHASSLGGGDRVPVQSSGTSDLRAPSPPVLRTYTGRRRRSIGRTPSSAISISSSSDNQSVSFWYHVYSMVFFTLYCSVLFRDFRRSGCPR